MSQEHVESIAGKIGLMPGAVVHVGEKYDEPIKISIIEYNKEILNKIDNASEKDVITAKENDKIVWFQVEGVHNPEVVAKLGEIFKLHPLVVEDILNTRHRPKVEDFEEYLFIVAKMFAVKDEELEPQQINLVLGKDYVLSFQELAGDPFAAVKERITKAKGRIRRLGPDYLAYALLDVVVDSYFQVLDTFSDALEEVEETVVSDPSQENLQVLHELKRRSLTVRRSLLPLREVSNSLIRGDTALVQDASQPFLRDIYDHAVQLIDRSETIRENISSLKDVYLSSVSNRMNQVMKVLTIIATLFIPITFVAGLYGMNFKHMPELELKWAYPASLGVMAATTVGMLIYFWRKRWL